MRVKQVVNPQINTFLFLLKYFKEPITQSIVIRNAKIVRSTFMYCMDWYQKNGLVCTVGDSNKVYNLCFRLTEKGVKLYEKVKVVEDEINKIESGEDG